MKNRKKAFFYIAILVLIFFMALSYTYKQTRESYRSVGFNEGQLYAHEKFVSTVEALVKLNVCQLSAEERKQATEIIRIKSDSILALKGEHPSEIKLCRQ